MTAPSVRVEGTSINLTPIVVGPSSATDVGFFQVISGNLGSANPTPRLLTVNQGGRMNLLGSMQIGYSIKINNGGQLDFAPSAAQIEMKAGGVIEVNAGGVFNLDNPLVKASDPLVSGITNTDGLVVKSSADLTEVRMGYQNLSNLSLLKINAGPTGELHFTGKVNNPAPRDRSIFQSDGAIHIYPDSTLTVEHGLWQVNGEIIAIGAAVGLTTSRLNGGMGAIVTLQKGLQGVGGGGGTSRETTLSSNMRFEFGELSKFKFGINPVTNRNDVLRTTSQVVIGMGAKAILETGNLGGVFVPSRLWTFIESTAGGMNNIQGTFTAVVAPYAIALDAAKNKYRLQT